MEEEFDYIIVGAGSAGCVLADRLSADEDVRVLLLEAGPRDTHPLIHVPIGIQVIVNKEKYNWGYRTYPTPEVDGREILLPRGKMLGGSSSLNGMIYIRGNARDYDGWAEKGLSGWSYKDVLPYFKRQEKFQLGENPYHGAEGPLFVSPDTSKNPLYDAFVAAGKSAGFKLNDDFNGPDQEGFGRFHFTIRKGRRWSAADAFLRPALRRSNLKVIVGAMATRILLEGDRATGVEYLEGNSRRRARAGREILVSAGAVNSPHLLMLSGIGDGDDLKKAGIRVLVHLPGIGKNLHDHIGVRQLHVSKVPTFTDRLSRMEIAPFLALQAMLFGSGPASQFPLIGGAFVKTDPGLDIPDVQFQFIAGNLMTPLRFPFRPPTKDVTRPDGFSILICQIRPRSRGAVTLSSGNPLDAPRITPNYLSEASDRKVIRKAFKTARVVMSQPEISNCSQGELWPGPSVKTDEEIDRIIKTNGTTIHHPVGTCRMGTDEMAVVDGDLRVRGIDALRVVDASVMPGIIGGNTNAPVMMIAEKAAEMIKAC